MPLIEEKKRREKPEGLVKPSGPNLFSQMRNRVRVQNSKSFRIDWRYVRKKMKKMLHDLWYGYD